MFETNNILGLSQADLPNATYMPGVQDFDNFSTGVACGKKAAKQSALTSKLYSIFNTAESMVDKITPLIEPRLCSENPLPESNGIKHLNIDLAVSKIISPKTGDLPACLAAVLTGEKIGRGAGSLGDILDPLNPSIDDPNKITSAASHVIEKKIDTYNNNVEYKANAAELMVKKVVGMLIDPLDKELFEKLDELSRFIKESDFVNVYKDWKDATNCIKKNCPILGSMISDDNFLWADKKHTMFILPIDINNGRVRIHKFFGKLTPSQKNEADNIEIRYYRYVEAKKQILDLGAQKTRDKGISEELNPFVHAKEKLIFPREKLVNTLF